jgi:hypothetical protein
MTTLLVVAPLLVGIVVGPFINRVSVLALFVWPTLVRFLVISCVVRDRGACVDARVMALVFASALLVVVLRCLLLDLIVRATW